MLAVPLLTMYLPRWILVFWFFVTLQIARHFIPRHNYSNLLDA